MKKLKPKRECQQKCLFAPKKLSNRYIIMNLLIQTFYGHCFITRFVLMQKYFIRNMRIFYFEPKLHWVGEKKENVQKCQ